jgi:phosphonate transport system permease protein
MTSATLQRGRSPPFPWFLRWPGLVLLCVLALAYRGSEGDVRGLFAESSRRAIADFLGGFVPPAHGAEFLASLWRPLAETVAIAVLGISLAIALALPLSVLAASPEVFSPERPGVVRRALHHLARLLLNLMRSIPELIWALLFVRAVGIGAAPGVLAIGIGYAGILGKVFAEIFESVPRAPAHALAGLGATPARGFTFGILPGAAPMLASYSLYRLDCAMRASAILGLVGAGGVGQQIELSMKMFAYDEVATLVAVLFLLVAAVDRSSTYVRRRIHASAALFPHGPSGLWRRLGGVAGYALVLAGCAFVLELPWEELLSLEALLQMGALVTSMFPPDLHWAFLGEAAPLVGETLAVSVLGTALAAVGGLLLAYPAVHRDGQGEAAAMRLVRGAVGRMCQALLNLGRTLPELLWALLFIFALGLGPFAGALALAVHTAGVLGRLYAEALEEVPRAPYQAMRGLGASHLSATVFAVLPQAFPQLVAYTLYRWEVNIRASTVLGVVGAGGIGTALHVSLSLFDHHRTSSWVILIVVMVTVVDALSGWLRRQVMVPNRVRLRPEAIAGQVCARVDGRRLPVLDLSGRGVRLFAGPGELDGAAAGALLPLQLELGGAAIACKGRVAWRQDDLAGVQVGLSLEQLGLWDRWRLYRLTGGRKANPEPPTPTSLEAF